MSWLRRLFGFDKPKWIPEAPRYLRVARAYHREIVHHADELLDEYEAIEGELKRERAK